MINIQELTNSCIKLHKRTGISIEIHDSSTGIIVQCPEKCNLSENKESMSIHPRNSKDYILYALDKNGERINDTALQLISVYFEPIFSEKKSEELFRDIIYGKISEDIYTQHLHTAGICTDIYYRTYILRCNGDQNNDILYIIKEILDFPSGDNAFFLNSENMLIIKECSNEQSAEDAAELANALLQSISMEIASSDIQIGVSKIYNSLTEISNAYKSASDALRVGCICAPNRKVHIADKLHIELFLDMLPKNTLYEFLSQHSNETISEAWDDKMIDTVQALFDNNLNMSIAARELYTHRNTLIYRLDKIKKISGLDLKSFDDAVIFKILMAADNLVNSRN